MKQGPDDRARPDNLAALKSMVKQLAQITAQLSDFVEASGSRTSEPEPSAFAFNDANENGPMGIDRGGSRATRPPLPAPSLVRQIIRNRQLRGRYFQPELLSDPVWDMLLDLTAARAEHKRVSVGSLCIAAGVPATTALRWITHLVELGLFERIEDDMDRRRAFVALSDKAAQQMAWYFAELGPVAAKMS